MSKRNPDREVYIYVVLCSLKMICRALFAVVSVHDAATATLFEDFACLKQRMCMEV